MKMIPAIVLGLLFSFPAFAAPETLRCEARFDEGSVYRLEAILEGGTVSAPVSLRYVTDDGLDLAAAMKATGFRRAGGVLQLQASNESMALSLDAPNAGEGMEFPARLVISFSLEHAEDLELEARCFLR